MKRELLLEVKRLHSEGVSKAAIARQIGVNRKTVRRALSKEPGDGSRPHGRPSVLAGYRGFLLGKLEAFPTITATRLFQLLKASGYKGGYDAVKEYVRPLRPAAKPAFHTLRFAPGEMAQVDWASAGVMEVDGRMRRVSVFLMTLCHSRLLYADLTLGEGLEFFLECHWNAFKELGGAPSKIMVDNCKTAVLSHTPGQVQFNPRYADFAACCGFEIRACHPRCPNEKGQVERAVSFLRSGFLTGRGQETFAGRRNALAEWLSTVANVRIHGATGLVPKKLFESEERQFLRPLPASPPPCFIDSPVQASSQFRVVFDTNRYSVPPRFAGQRLTMRRSMGKVAFLSGDALVAEHLRCFGLKRDVLNPAHDHELLALSRGRREQRAVASLLNLGGAAPEYLARLRDKMPNWLSHAERILVLEQAYGRDQAERALRDALEAEAFGAEYIRNLLEVRAAPIARPSPLSCLRGDDILKLSLPEPDLSQY